MHVLLQLLLTVFDINRIMFVIVTKVWYDNGLCLLTCKDNISHQEPITERSIELQYSGLHLTWNTTVI